jgi:hypothetical protein
MREPIAPRPHCAARSSDVISCAHRNGCQMGKNSCGVTLQLHCADSLILFLLVEESCTALGSSAVSGTTVLESSRQVMAQNPSGERTGKKIEVGFQIRLDCCSDRSPKVGRHVH